MQYSPPTLSRQHNPQLDSPIINMSLTYSEYKATTVPGVPTVPKHWRVARLKHLCTAHSLYGANIPAHQYRESGVRFLRTTDITEDGRLTEQGVHLPAQSVADFLLTDGDILVSRSGTVGRSFLYNRDSHGPCAYAGYLVRFVPHNLYLARYIYHFTKTPGFQEFLRTSAISSTIENVNAEKYANCLLPLPPPDEQAAIVRYLDHADELIDRYISAKKRLIALLEEQRQAVIHQAVTRGLNHGMPLKSSGIPWLGDVPKHWEVRRIRNAADMRVSNVDKHTYAEELPIRLCNYVDVYKNDSITDAISFMLATATEAEIDQFRLELHDVLITKDSETWTDIGVPALVEHTAPDLICGYHIAILRPLRSSLDGRYLFRILQDAALSSQFHVAANGVTRYGLSHSSIKSILLPIPPLDEQAAIVEFLDESTAKANVTIDRARRQITLMNEYRTRLIADVVTGQLDVRSADVNALEIPAPHS